MPVRSLPDSGVLKAESLETALAFIPLLAGMPTLPNPPWIRTKGSTWVMASRVVKPGAYRRFGLIIEPQLHLSFWKTRGYKRSYQVPIQVITAFLASGSKGKFVHRVLLGKGWNQFNKQCRYINWPIIS